MNIYRRLLHDLCENMKERSFITLKELIEGRPEVSMHSLQKLHEPQKLFLLMEESDMINCHHYNLIYGIFFFTNIILKL